MCSRGKGDHALNLVVRIGLALHYHQLDSFIRGHKDPLLAVGTITSLSWYITNLFFFVSSIKKDLIEIQTDKSVSSWTRLVRVGLLPPITSFYKQHQQPLQAGCSVVQGS
jgi:hypothetical protein